MVIISYSNDSLTAQISGSNFNELIDLLKSVHGRWSPETKLWSFPIKHYKHFIEEVAKMHDAYEVDYKTELMLANYESSLKELEHSSKRKTWHQELLSYPPLEGKHPYEDFQKEDLMRAMNQNRFLFNWKMGLGKSYALAALIAHGWHYKEFCKCLVFSSNVGVLNVRNELLKFMKDLKPEDVIAFSSAGTANYEDRDIFNEKKYPQKIIIMTYDFLKVVSNFYYDKKCGYDGKGKKPSSEKKYKKSAMPVEEWLGSMPGALFLDENHYLAHPESRRTKTFSWIWDFFKYRYLFTATLADKYEKLYIPCRILDKDLVHGDSFIEWAAEYNELGNKWSKYAINPNKWDLEKIGELNRRLLAQYGSKRGNECLDLPDHFFMPTFYIDMSKEQRDIYEMFSQWNVLRLQEEAKAKGSNLAKDILNLFPFLQMSVDNPSSILRSSRFKDMPEQLQKAIKKFDYVRDSRKINAINDVIADRVEEEDEKGIIWYYHPETGYTLYDYCKKYKPVLISADVPKEERLDKIQEFLHNPEEMILIASINVVNTSVTLTECAWDFYAEATYDYTVYEQSTGRIARPGQDKTVRTYSARYNDSLDIFQEKNLQTKGVLMGTLMNAELVSNDIWKKLFNFQKDMTMNSEQLF